MKLFKDLIEDVYAADRTEKQWIDPATGKTKKRKIQAHRIQFAASKLHKGQDDEDGRPDYLKTEETMEQDQLTKELHEVLSKDAKAGDWIHDFVHSTNPKFEGKSKKERIRMALGAYYAKQRNEELEHILEYGDTEKGQRMLAKVQKRATDRLIKADDKNRLEPDYTKRDLKTVKKNAATAQRAYDRMEEEMVSEALDPSEIAGNPSMYNADTVKKAYYHKNASESDKQSLARHLDRHHGNKEWRKPVKEEQEQIDELSKSTLGSYVKNAARDVGASRKIATDFEHSSKSAKKQSVKDANKRLADKFKDIASKRHAGIGKAVERLTKEELVGNQNKLDKNHNGKLDKQDFKILRGAKKVQENHEYEDGSMSIHELKQIKAHVDWILEMLKPETDMPEWVQAKITLAADYLSTACDYLHVEMNEEVKEPTGNLKDACWSGYTAVGMKMKNGRKVPNCVPVKEGVNDRPKSTEQKSTKTSFKVETPWVHSQTGSGNVTDKGGHVHTPYSRARHLARQAMQQMQKEDTYAGLEKEPKKGLPTAVVKTSKTAVKSDTVEGWDHPADAVKKNLKKEGMSYKDFALMLEYTPDPSGRTIVRGTYGRAKGAQYGETDYDKETLDHKDTETNEPKRGRGRPAGSKSGARKITGTSKLYK